MSHGSSKSSGSIAESSSSAFFSSQSSSSSSHSEYVSSADSSGGGGSFPESSSESLSSDDVGTCTIEWNSLSWAGQNNGDPWVITRNGSRIRVNVEDSENCGGSNDNIQTAGAEAQIQVGASDIYLGFEFSGIAEVQATGFEAIYFYLNGNLVASATSPGGNTSAEDTCEMGPSIVDYHVPPPYLLEADTLNYLEIEFNTGDSLYHVNSYYQANFTCETA